MVAKVDSITFDVRRWIQCSTDAEKKALVKKITGQEYSEYERAVADYNIYQEKAAEVGTLLQGGSPVSHFDPPPGPADTQTRPGISVSNSIRATQVSSSVSNAANSGDATPGSLPNEGSNADVAIPYGDDSFFAKYCGKDAFGKADPNSRTPFDRLLAVKENSQFSKCLLLLLSKYPGGVSQQPLNSLAYIVQGKIDAQSGWVLPALYGALGACLYLLRVVVSIKSPNVELIPAFVRIIVGGIGGLVVGWFWVPSTGSFNSGGSAPAAFALALLAGFSLDLVFSMLEKAIKLFDTK
jgi:hypothetical protein